MLVNRALQSTNGADGLLPTARHLLCYRVTPQSVHYRFNLPPAGRVLVMTRTRELYGVPEDPLHQATGTLKTAVSPDVRTSDSDIAENRHIP